MRASLPLFVLLLNGLTDLHSDIFGHGYIGSIEQSVKDGSNQEVVADKMWPGF